MLFLFLDKHPAGRMTSKTDCKLPIYAADADISGGIQCVLCAIDSTRKFFGWSRLWNHTRHVHGLRAVDYPADNVLRKKHREEENLGRKAFRTEKPEENAEFNKRRRERRTKRTATEAELATMDSHKKIVGTDGVWIVKPCYVKATAQGEVLSPLKVLGLAALDGPRDSSQEPGQEAENSASSSTGSQQDPAQMHMMTEMYLDFKAKQREELREQNWKTTVPVVQVKQSYRDQAAPKGKRDCVDIGKAKEPKVGRGTWPKKMDKDKIALDDFEQYLEREHRGASSAVSLVRGAGRALGCLEVLAPADGTASPHISDVKILVGLYLGDGHQQLLDIPLLHPRFSWTEDLLEGLANYAAYWARMLQQFIVKGSSEPLLKYKECLNCLIEDLKGGHAKKCAEWKELGYQAKAAEDLQVLKNFPSISHVIQPAVERAYRTLKHLWREYGAAVELPSKVRALANAIIVGCWHYDTYLGRKWEIEHCLFETIEDALLEGQEYILCRQHKTRKTYGDIVKYLSPGLLVALNTYKMLPRPEGCKYFLVPARCGAETISVPTSLKTFNKIFLQSAKVSPCTNHVRKLFHNELMKLTRNENALKDFMTILDAHGREVQDKHYLIRTPEDDLACAKALVLRVLGQTVAWPYEFASTTDIELVNNALEGQVEDVESDPTGTDFLGACDVDDEPYDTWEFGAAANPESGILGGKMATTQRAIGSRAQG